MTTLGNKIRVWFAIPELHKGGPDRVFFEILRKIDRSKFAPALLVGKNSGYYFSRLPKDVPVHLVSSKRYPLLSALRLVRKHRPHIVFTTLRMGITMGLASPFFPSGTKLIIRQANQFSENFSFLVKKSLLKHRIAKSISLFCFKRAHSVVCQSEDMKRDLQSLIGSDVVLPVIGNPVDTDEVDEMLSNKKVALSGKPALVSVGRLAHQKGFDLLLQSIAILKPKFPELHLTILGEGQDGDKLRKLATELSISHMVTFAGFNPEPLPMVQAASMFVLASRYEGFSNASLEAAACGTPVVLTNTPGGHQELIRPGLNGRLAPVCEPGAIAKTIEETINELPRFNRQTIKDDCRDRFSTSRIVNLYEQVFETAMLEPALATRKAAI